MACGLKGQDIPGQGTPCTVPRNEALVHGNALGNKTTNTLALKGRDIARSLMARPYIPPFQG